VLPWSPLGGGFLSGKYTRSAPLPSGTRLAEKKERYARFDNERCWRTLDAVQAVATELAATPAAVSLAWLLHKPQVTSAIFGARDVAQLEDNVKACEVSLNPEQLKRLDDASALELGYPYGFMGNIQGRW